MRKKIVMYFRKRLLSQDPFETFGTKRVVYHQLFQAGINVGFDMFIASGDENYEEPLLFRNAFIYAEGRFNLYPDVCQADAVFDRSGGVFFPPKSIGQKVLNNIEFKELCSDKNSMKEILGDLMPKSFRIQNTHDLLEKLGKFHQDELVVLKPSRGMQGKGIIIDSPSNIRKIFTFEKGEYCLQEFVNTSAGIQGITDTHHDIRIVIANGNITLSHVRNPKQGSLLANVAQGGSLREIPIGKLPNVILDLAKETQNLLDKEYDFPLYSVDVGIRNDGKPFIFELNDQIGFPSESMRASGAFIREILESLKKRADR